MFEVGIYEAKTNLPEIVRRVEAGEECIITRRGEPVAKLSGAKSGRQNAAAWQAIIDHSRKHPINATLEEMIAWKNEGRP